MFVTICGAIQHAHQKGIIHRDLKPSNVLVTILDGKAVPKIIDFGVAKATAQKLTDQTMHTQLGVMIGTPAYMSPEQVRGEDLTAASDVYSPVSGEVVEANEVLADAPETINQDAYEEGLKRHRETEKFADEYERERLKEEEERARIEQETIKPVAPATGGTAVAPYRNRPVQKKPDLPLDNVGGRPVTLPEKTQ